MQEIRWISGWLKVHNTKVAAEEAELDASAGGAIGLSDILSEDEEIRNAEDGGLRVCASRGVIGGRSNV